jgi:hypothetical protein
MESMMSAKLVAEYAVADHLVVYSEGSISIWKREASLRPARKRLREAAVLAPHQQRAAAVQGLYAGRSAAAEARERRLAMIRRL